MGIFWSKLQTFPESERLFVFSVGQCVRPIGSNMGFLMFLPSKTWKLHEITWNPVALPKPECQLATVGGFWWIVVMVPYIILAVSLSSRFTNDPPIAQDVPDKVYALVFSCAFYFCSQLFMACETLRDWSDLKECSAALQRRGAELRVESWPVGFGFGSAGWWCQKRTNRW